MTNMTIKELQIDQKRQQWIQKLLPQVGHDEFIVSVFKSTKTRPTDDMADLYAIVTSQEADGGLILYGYSERREEWVANWSARHAMRHLLTALLDIQRCSTIGEVASVLSHVLNGYLLDDVTSLPRK